MVGTLRVFVAGSTGPLGRRLVAELAERGHVAVGLTADRDGDELVAEAGGVPRRGEVTDRDSLSWAMADADVVVDTPPLGPPLGDDVGREAVDRRRRVGAKNLTIEAGSVGADRYVQASVVWLVRKPSGGPVDEFTPPNPDPTTESLLLAERRTRASKKFDLQPATLRVGWPYGHDDAGTRALARRLLAHRLPVVGGGVFGRTDAELSLVHLDDAATAFADACERWETGTYHVVDDRPVTVARLFEAFADRLGAPDPRRVPAWLGRHLLDESTARFLSTGFPTDAEAFGDEFGWSPAVGNYEEGLDLVIERLVDDGLLREQDGGYEWAGT